MHILYVSLTTLHSFYNYVWGPWEGTVISEPCFKGTILQRNDREMTISWSFSYNSFVKFQGKKNWEQQND